MYKPKSNLLNELYLRGYIHQCTNIEKLDYRNLKYEELYKDDKSKKFV